MPTDYERIRQLADKLNQERKRQANIQAKVQKRQDWERENAWFGPTLGGALTGLTTGAMVGGVPGALAGAAIGGTAGYVGRKQFNNNPAAMPAINQAATTVAGMYNRRQPLGQVGEPDFSSFGAGGMQDLSLTTGTPGLGVAPSFDTSALDAPALSEGVSLGGQPKLKANFTLKEPNPLSDVANGGMDFQGINWGEHQFDLETPVFEYRDTMNPPGQTVSPDVMPQRTSGLKAGASTPRKKNRGQ